MGTDNLFRDHSIGRQRRISKEIKIRAETWLIVCEGKETEPNYFKSLLEYANSKSNYKIKFRIEGTGKNTESLVSSIENFFNVTGDLANSSNIPYGKIFAVFDKDSFKKKQFNNAINVANTKGYKPIWSNECIELWFLLHFNLMESNISRNEYFDKLGPLMGCKYNKTDDHFSLLNTEKNLKIAIKNAKRLYEASIEESSYANRAPCTTVFQLIEELERYLCIKLS